MLFRLTDRQRAFREEMRELVKETLDPQADQLDKDSEYPHAFLGELGDRRLTGLTLPETHGGRDEGLVELALFIEEVSASLMAAASVVGLHLGVASVIDRFGTDVQRDAYLPSMASFDCVGALGLSEADAGSDKTGIETSAQRDSSGETMTESADATASEEDGGWVLNGHKQWVTNLPEADVVLTYARTGAEPTDVSAFLVPADAFVVETEWETLGARSVESPRARLDDVTLPADALVGAEGEALAERGQLYTGVNVPARAVGIAQAAVDDTVTHVSEREQYGGPLSDLQGLGWGVATMAERVETARLLTLRAADRADRGGDPTREFAMAKIHATEAAVENATDAMQYHGGIGYTNERRVERYLRDAKLLTIAGGPNEKHRDSLADAVFETYG